MGCSPLLILCHRLASQMQPLHRHRLGLVFLAEVLEALELKERQQVAHCHLLERSSEVLREPVPF